MLPVLQVDFRDAVRALTRRPGFVSTLVLTLGLGIGAVTTVYGFVYALLLRPYPYAAPDRLVRVQSVYTEEGGARRGMSLLDLEDIRRQARTVEGIGAYELFDARLLTDGPPVVVSTAHISAEALSLLGVPPVLGRLLRAEEDRPGGDVFKAVISHQVWRDHFGADPAVVGRALRTDRQSYTIVGVMSEGFAFPERVGIWAPIESWYASLDATDTRREKWRGARWYATVARLGPGVTTAQAEADLNAIAAGLERDYPRDNDGIRVALTPLRDFETGPVRPYLMLCLTGVVFLLLICCVNVANLLVVRSVERRRDFAIMMALGAGGGRLVRGLLLESLLVGMAGAIVGALIALAGVRGLLALIPVPLPAWVRIEVDSPVLAVTVAVSLVTTLLFGLGPALAERRPSLTGALRVGARGSTRSPVRAGLVVVEVALTVVLLMGAGLLMRTLLHLQARDPGFRPDGVLAVRVVLWALGERVQSAGALSSVHERVLTALRGLPGVRAAAVTNRLPYADGGEGRFQADIFIEGRSRDHAKTLAPISGADVSTDYFRVMRIPLVRGRLFEPIDTPTSDPVIVISQHAAELFFPGRDPIGQRISWGQVTDSNPWTRVIGVVGNVRQRATEGEAGVEFYYPITQWPAAASYYVVRTESDPAAMAETVRRTILNVEPTVAVAGIKTVEQTMGESLWQQRLWSVLFAAFAALALALAAIGIYGVLSYAVSQRTREIGVRLALGAEPVAVRRLIVREGLWLCAAGATLGLAAALALGRVIGTLLAGVVPHDPVTGVAVVATVVSTAAAACWLPARRASQVDPAVALHTD